MRVGTCFDGMQQLHIADVVDIDLVLEYHDKSLPVEFDREDSCWKGELADGRLALLMVQRDVSIQQMRLDVCSKSIK